jgi:LysR family nitrogen assimilation transcriptional regulator
MNTLPTDSSMLDPDLLVVFCRVAETLNFSRAAAHLGLAQPVVTRKIRRLEEILGVSLFLRSNRGCTLTPEGELLASKAAGVLLQQTHLNEEVGKSARGVTGTIAIGMTVAAGTLLAPHLLPAIAAQWPELRVELYEAVTRHLLNGVLNRELSVALLYDPPTDLGLHMQPLLMDRLCLAGPPEVSEEFARLSKASVRDIARLPLVLPVRSQIIRELLEDAFAEASLPLKPRYETNSPTMLKAMVSQGLGYTVLTMGSLEQDIATGKLVAIPLSDPGMSLTLTLVTSADYGQLRVVQLVAGLISKLVRQLVTSGQWPGTPQLMQSSP